MPRLTRRDRNQRVAIAGVILLFAAYLALRPLMNSLSGSPRTSSKAPPATQGLRKR